jgi:hypothetical protein
MNNNNNNNNNALNTFIFRYKKMKFVPVQGVSKRALQL